MNRKVRYSIDYRDATLKGGIFEMEEVECGEMFGNSIGI